MLGSHNSDVGCSAYLRFINSADDVAAGGIDAVSRRPHQGGSARDRVAPCQGCEDPRCEHRERPSRNEVEALHPPY